MAEGRTGFAKAEDDWYVEQPQVTTWLLAREYFIGRVLDPACGQGNVVTACLAGGLDACGSDLRRRVPEGTGWFVEEADYLAPGDRSPWCRNVITNPPYGRAKLAEAFIRKTLQRPHLEKAAFLVNGKFLFGSGRAQGLYRDHPPTRVYPIWPRPSIPPGEFLLAGGKAEGGVENFVWLVYSAGETGSSIVW